MSFYPLPLTRGGVNKFQHFCGRGKEFEGGLDAKGGVNFWRGGGSGFLEIAVINFTSGLLLDLLLTRRLKDVVSLVIFPSRF